MFNKIIAAVLARRVMAGRRGVQQEHLKLVIYLGHDFYTELRASANNLDLSNMQELMSNSTIAGCPVNVVYPAVAHQVEEPHPDFLVADYTDYEILALKGREIEAVPINCCNQGRATGGSTHSITCPKGGS
jgi:hypothetical protein